MKSNPKTIARTSHAPITATTEKWHAVDAASTALQTELTPLLQPLGEAERRQLLRVDVANAAFAAEYATLLQAQPGLVPDLLKPADTLRDWQTCQELRERLPALRRLVQDIQDTIDGMEADCFAAALGAYRILVRGGLQVASHPGFEAMRAHIEARQVRRRQTRAANAALKAAQDALAAAQPPGGSNGAPTPAAVIVPMNAGGPSGPRGLSRHASKQPRQTQRALPKGSARSCLRARPWPRLAVGAGLAEDGLVP